jgi:hypothetical protein
MGGGPSWWRIPAGVIPPAMPGAELCNPLRGYRSANNEIQCGHTGPPLRQDGIVGHGPIYGTKHGGNNMIGVDRPQRGHNMLAHGSAVGVGRGMANFAEVGLPQSWYWQGMSFHRAFVPIALLWAIMCDPSGVKNNSC